MPKDPGFTGAGLEGLAVGRGAGCGVGRGGGEGGGDGGTDAVELVVAGDFFDEEIGFGFVEDEGLQVVEEEVGGEEASDQGFELVFEARFVGLVADGPPRQEPFGGGGEGADAGVEAVTDGEGGVVGEEVADVFFVGLELAVGFPDVGIEVGEVFEFDNG